MLAVFIFFEGGGVSTSSHISAPLKLSIITSNKSSYGFLIHGLRTSKLISCSVYYKISFLLREYIDIQWPSPISSVNDIQYFAKEENRITFIIIYLGLSHSFYFVKLILSYTAINIIATMDIMKFKSR